MVSVTAVVVVNVAGPISNATFSFPPPPGELCVPQVSVPLLPNPSTAVTMGNQLPTKV